MVRVSGREYNGLIESPCFEHATDDSRSSRASRATRCTSRRTTRGRSRRGPNDQLAAGHGRQRGVRQCHEPFARRRDADARTRASGGFRRAALLQLPHAVHDLRPAQDHSQPHGEQPLGRESVDSGRPNACNLCHLDKSLAWTGGRARSLAGGAGRSGGSGGTGGSGGSGRSGESGGSGGSDGSGQSGRPGPFGPGASK